MSHQSPNKIPKQSDSFSSSSSAKGAAAAAAQTGDRSSFYAELHKRADQLTKSTTDYIANTSNVAALIYRQFQKTFGVDSINWAGFYFVRYVQNPVKKEEGDGKAEIKEDNGDHSNTLKRKVEENNDHPDQALVLGPFHGEPAVQLIAFGAGVCGTAWEKREIQLVPNVHECENHIACDNRSQSEVVVPLYADAEKKTLVGVLDMDSPVINGFSSSDAEGLQRIADMLQQRCEWLSVKRENAVFINEKYHPRKGGACTIGSGH